MNTNQKRRNYKDTKAQSVGGCVWAVPTNTNPKRQRGARARRHSYCHTCGIPPLYVAQRSWSRVLSFGHEGRVRLQPEPCLAIGRCFREFNEGVRHIFRRGTRSESVSRRSKNCARPRACYFGAELCRVPLPIRRCATPSPARGEGRIRLPRGEKSFQSPHILHSSSFCTARRANTAYSHSIVLGGFELMSYTTRLIPRTVFVIRVDMLCSTS